MDTTSVPEGHMVIDIRRRKLIVALGGTVVWPLAALAQPAMPLIGFLSKPVVRRPSRSGAQESDY